MLRTPPGPYQEAIAAAAMSMDSMEERVRSNVLTTARTHTSFLDLPQIRKVLGSSSFRLADLRNGRVSVYLCLPLNEVRGSSGRWLRMFAMLTVDMMFHKGRRPKVPILLAIDEFPSLGPMPSIELVAPTLRSRGVRLWVIGQDIQQFQETYPKSWRGFIGGAEAVQFMGIKDPLTVDYIVERLGEHLVRRPHPRNPGETIEAVRNLLNPNQVSELLAARWQNQIVWRGDRKPMLLKICPYFNYLPARYFSPDPNYRQKFRHAVWRAFFPRR
jgi:type IV secretion system protein VirD4